VTNQKGGKKSAAETDGYRETTTQFFKKHVQKLKPPVEKIFCWWICYTYQHIAVVPYDYFPQTLHSCIPWHIYW
jgi:hypothetical protein